MGASKWFFSVSGVILLIGALAIGGKGLNFGIDFESGTRITAPLERAASVDARARRARAAGPRRREDPDRRQPGARRQRLPDLHRHARAGGRRRGQRRRSTTRFGLADDANVESIGPTFGETVANSALIAIIASLLVITAYIALRFEWKYAVPVLIALMHDILITAGVYSLIGREVTTSTVAALLTILGFSLYDTIIVFDRIRENVPRMPSAAFSQIVNRSMTEVIVRSLATSFCTLLPVLALLLFGGETLQDFAFALLVGTLSGTYSSVFIAGPVLTHWKEREPVYRTRERRIRAELGYVPAYAVPMGSAPVDVAPAEPRGGRRSITAPQDPTQVSQEEFDDDGPRPRDRARSASRAEHRRRHAAARPAAAARAPTAGAARAGRAGGPARSPPARRRRRAAEAARSRATASTGGRADGHARLGDDGPRPLALHDLPPRPLLGRDRRRVRRRAVRRGPLRARRSTASPSRARTTPTSRSALEAIPGALRRHRARLLRRRAARQRSRVALSCGARAARSTRRARPGTG